MRHQDISEYYIPPLIAHRGASAYAPENTLASFLCAHQHGAEWVETDIYLTADQEIICIHDENLHRYTGVSCKVTQTNYAELLRYDIGSWFDIKYADQRIVKLKDALIMLSQLNMGINIEIKPQPNMNNLVKKCIKLIKEYWPARLKPPLISSFDHQALTLARQFDPHIPLGLLLDKWDKEWITKAANLKCISVHLPYRLAITSHIKAIKKRGYKLLVFTINDKTIANNLFAKQIDSIFSDYPNLLTIKNK
ncbi:MAG: glycerophosphodiester phosphodiesterase [Gammaproteobacteria bacterium]